MTAIINDMLKEALPEIFVERNVVAAEQTFHRRLAEYEMNIEQQKLLREDLRDLVELTVGRMDIYHLVGALLLEFSIHLFCENHLLVEAEEKDLPRWVLTFFLLTNLSAAGYLIFAVWLSMHAAVASHSIGVRLLTKFARLSIPTREELEEVCSVPLVGLMERFKNLGQRFGFKKDEQGLGAEEQVGASCGSSVVGDAVPKERRHDKARYLSNTGDPNGLRSSSSMPVLANNLSEGSGMGPSASQHVTFQSEGGRSDGGFPKLPVQPRSLRLPTMRSEGGAPASAGFRSQAAMPLLTQPSSDALGMGMEDEPRPRQHAHFAIPPDPLPAFASEMAAAVPERAIDEGAKACADRSAHFRRFMEEQRRWVNYDAYARVCMSLGINQMLTALSYYVIGTFALKSPRSALISLFGIQLLSLLLLRLDLVAGDNAKLDATKVFLFVPVPPIYLAMILCTWDVHMVSELFLSVMALPAFLLHAGWLMLVAFVLIPRRAIDNAGLPKQMRTVLYLDVVQLEQDSDSQQVFLADAEEIADLLSDARLLLEDKMREVTAEEAELGVVSKARRNTEELLDLEASLHDMMNSAEEDLVQLETKRQDTVSNLEEAELRKKVRETRREIKKASHALDHFEVWRSAPEVLAHLMALKSVGCQGWYVEEQRERIDCVFQGFLEKCRSLDLGISATKIGEGSYCFDGNDSEASAPVELNALEVASEEKLMVRVPASEICGSSNWAEASVWVEQGSARLHHEEPAGEKVTSFDGSLEGVVPEWHSKAATLLQSRGRYCFGQRPTVTRTGSRLSCRSSFGVEVSTPMSVAQACDRQSGLRRMSAAFGRLARLGNLRGAVTQPLIKAWETPPEQLPGVLVRRWSLGVALLWLLSAVLHSVDYGHHKTRIPREPLHQHHEDHFGHGRRLFMGWPSQSLTEPLIVENLGSSIAWPEPARLFEVVSMYCAESWVAVDNGFSVFVARRGPGNAIGRFEEVAETGPSGSSVLCSPDRCDLLSKGTNGAWAFSPLPFSGTGVAAAAADRQPRGPRPPASPAELPLPDNWRLVAAAWVPCAPSACQKLTLAGWDGSRIVIASAAMVADAAGVSAWKVRSRFSLQPSKDPCPGDASATCSAALAPTQGRRGRRAAAIASGEYGEVRALQFGPGARTLTVLSANGTVDAWDLHLGSRLGEWRHTQGNEDVWSRRRPDMPRAMCHDSAGMLFAHAATLGAVASAAPGPRLTATPLPLRLRVAGDWQAAWSVAAGQPLPRATPPGSVP